MSIQFNSGPTVKRHNYQQNAEMNITPFVDVMLVLLIIFMVTAPMLMQGVEVDLPEARTEPVDNQDSEPLIVSVNQAGQLFINLGAQEDRPLSLATVKQRVSAVMQRNPAKPVLVWGDRAVAYGEVVTLMAALQEAGAPSVGLVTDDPK
jgi:biopolymer transport protein TolR